MLLVEGLAAAAAAEEEGRGAVEAMMREIRKPEVKEDCRFHLPLSVYGMSGWIFYVRRLSYTFWYYTTAPFNLSVFFLLAYQNSKKHEKNWKRRKGKTKRIRDRDARKCGQLFNPNPPPPLRAGATHVVVVVRCRPGGGDEVKGRGGDRR